MAPDVANPAPSLDRTALKPLLVPLGCLLLTLLLWNVRRVTLGALPGFPLDDPYITLHNAQVLLSGRPDPVYVGTPPLVGSTSVVHTALVALLCILLRPETALDASQWIAFFLYALGLVRLAQANGASPARTALTVVVGLTAARTAYHLFNGLETGLGMAGITWALVLTARPKPTAWFGALLGALPFVRPELALASVALGARFLLGRPGRAEALRFVAAGLAGALPWMALGLAAGGGVLPGTIGAKDAYFAVSSLPLGERAWRFWRGLQVEAVALGPGVLLLPLACRIRGGAFALAAFVGTLALYLLKLPMAVEANGGRYWHLFVPLVAAGAAAPWRVGRIPVATLIAAGVAALAVWNLPQRLAAYRANVDWTAVEVRQTAAFVRDTLPADAVVMVHDAGMAGYLSRRRLVDLVGLKTPLAADVHREITLPSSGARRGDALVEIARRTGATHLVVLGEWEKIFGIGQAFVGHGWGLNLLREPHALYDYAVYEVVRPK